MKRQNGKDISPKFPLYSFLDTVYKDIHMIIHAEFLHIKSDTWEIPYIHSAVQKF